MVKLFARHPVADFEKWMAGYKQHADFRAANGVTADAVFQALDDPNDITVSHDFENLAAAQAFIASPELKSAMAELGVTGPPTIWITQQAS